MKKLSGVLVCLLLFTFISSARIIEVADAGITDKLRAVIAAKGAAVAACGLTSEPAGDIFSDGFEGSGSGGYELTATATSCASAGAPVWCNSATLDAAYALSELSSTGDTKNCNYGWQRVFSASSGVGTNYKTGSVPAEVYVETSFYLSSYDFVQWGTTDFLYVGTSSSMGVTNYGKLNLDCSAAGGCTNANLKLRAISASTVGSSNTLAVNTWYYARLTLKDAGSGTCAISVGTTYGGTDFWNTTFDCNDMDTGGSTLFFSFGSASTRTFTMTLGYMAADDDGTF